MANRLPRDHGTGRADWPVRSAGAGMARLRAVPPAANDNRPPLYVRLRMATGVAGVILLVGAVLALTL